MNKRKLNLAKHGISSKRYQELKSFCEQYPEWKQALSTMTDALKSAEITGMPHGSGTSDTTANIAEKRIVLDSKVNIVENTAKEVSADCWKYIIDNVCYDVPVRYLIYKGLPMSERAFSDMKKIFFFRLDKCKM